MGAPYNRAWRQWRRTRLAGVILSCSPATALADLRVELDQSVADAAESDAGVGAVEAIEAAARAWDRCLADLPKSIDLPVRIGLSRLPCDENDAVAARAITDVNLARGLVYPTALAAYLDGTELDETGLVVELNSELFSPEGCSGAHWSTALPESGATGGVEHSLFSAMQHELGHVLGLDVGYDVLEGPGGSPPSVYLTRLFSNRDRAALSELTADALRIAVSTPHNVVWSGKWTRTLAATLLAEGVPQMYVAPIAADTQPPLELLGKHVRLLSRGASRGPLQGKLTRLENACAGATDVAGQFVFLSQPSCGVEAAATNLIRDGAALIVFEVDTALQHEAPDLGVDVPVVLVDNEQLVAALAEGPLDVWFRVNTSLLSGADEKGRVYVFTPEQYEPAQSLVHLDQSTAFGSSPRFPTSNLPELGVGFDETCGFALSQLLDLGYAKPDCGDGVVGPDESCDDGLDNSDSRPEACRHSCELATCGDAVVDSGEQCDDGVLNARLPDVCRPGCVLPRCGDGVRDLANGEWCDDGPMNSDSGSASCRRDCTLPRCGDGILDIGEACDQGSLNGGEPDRCRVDCTAPRCGDGILDSDHGETCDDGNTVADPWCDETCTSRVPVSAPSAADGGNPPHSSLVEDAGTEAGLGETASVHMDAGPVPIATAARTVDCTCAFGVTNPPGRYRALVCGLVLLLLIRGTCSRRRRRVLP